MIRVVLLADDRITRAGVRILIDKESGMSVVGEHELIDDPAAVLATAQPHVTLVDIDRSNRDFAPELVARLSKKSRVIVLTNGYDPELVSSVFWSGAKGLVRKDETPTLLLKAIRRVDAGEVWLDRLTMARLLSELSRGGDAAASDAPRVGRLTLRERQLITVVSQGFGNNEIAERLHISEATVRNHLTSIFRKLELHSRVELVMYALRQGLIKSPISRPRPAHASTRRSRRIKSAS
jgi:two-component system, NarL family, nitrate/nitrite response regulator NarL